jgi:hypothetical protein
MSKSCTERLFARARLALVCGASGCLAVQGCATYGSHLSSTPVAPGASELSLSADALILDRGFGPQIVPNLEAGWRIGLGEDVDVGGRLNLAGMEANARFRVLDRGAFELALVPGLGFGFVPVTNADTGLFNLSALSALLLGVDLKRDWQLVIGPRGMAQCAFPLTTFRGDLDAAKLLYLAGGTLGLRFPLGKKTWIFPDVNVLVPYDSQRNEWQFPNIQAGVALAFE